MVRAPGAARWTALLLAGVWCALAAGARAQDCIDYGTLPRLVGAGDIPAARNLTLVGNRAYAACAEDGFRIADLSDPAAPVLLGHATWR